MSSALLSSCWGSLYEKEENFFEPRRLFLEKPVVHGSATDTEPIHPANQQKMFSTIIKLQVTHQPFSMRVIINRQYCYDF